MIELKKINAPFDKDAIKSLKAGDFVEISGSVYTARDAGHKRLCECLQNGEELPIDLKNQGIFYVGACFDNAKVISAGPTTAKRMDTYAPLLYDNGVVASLGKGDRSEEVYESIRRNGGVYFALIGGAGAIYAQCVKSASLIAYEDLGTEALYKFEIENLPAIVAIDKNGDSIFNIVKFDAENMQ